MPTINVNVSERELMKTLYQSLFLASKMYLYVLVMGKMHRPKKERITLVLVWTCTGRAFNRSSVNILKTM